MQAESSETAQLCGAGLRALLSSETTDKQLYELANRLCLRLDGIYYYDEILKLPHLTKDRTYNFILHLRDPAHWVALHKPKNRHEMYYFNSFADHFGDVPQDILDFAKKNRCILYTSDKPSQSPRTGMCGQYCILWLVYMNRATNDIYDFNDYLKLFKDMTPEILKYKEKNPQLPY